MRKKVFLIFIAALVWVVMGGIAPLSAEERILRFDVEAEIAPDASLTVTEHILIVTEGKEIKRGIIRTIPTDFTDTEGVKRRAGFDLISTLIDGKSTKVDVSRSGENLEYRIGDPDIIIPPGEHLFSIAYKTTGQLGFFEGHDELYWNVTGNDWAFPIEEASFRLKLPEGDYGEGFSAIEFYTGRRGDQGADARVDDDGTVRSTRAYGRGEGLTVVYSWLKGVVAQPAEPAPTVDILSKGLARVIHFGMPVIMLAVMFYVWRRWGRDPEPKAIIPLFEPPAGVGAALARHIRKMGTDEKVLVAMILDLAVRGVLRIEETDPSAGTGRGPGFLAKGAGQTFIIKLQRDKLKDTPLSPEEEELVESLFPYGKTEIGLSKKDGFAIGNAFRKMTRTLDKVARPFFSENQGKWEKGMMVYVAYVFALFAFMVIFNEQVMVSIAALLAVPCLLLPIMFPVSFKMRNLKPLLLRGLAIAFYLFIVGALVFSDEADQGEYDPLPMGAPILSMAVLAVFKPLMKARTEEGARVDEGIQGLARYMATAEKHQIEMFNPPEETPRLFERLLPYAFALDVADTWVDRFEKVLIDSKYEPDWYSGDTDDLAFAFAMEAFAEELERRTFISAPAGSGGSSSGSRSSGAGGGGSSGGGGGGGGGSGW